MVKEFTIPDSQAGRESQRDGNWPYAWIHFKSIAKCNVIFLEPLHLGHACAFCLERTSILVHELPGFFAALLLKSNAFGLVGT